MIEIELIPRAPFRAYLERTQRWGCLVVHRRGGKTFAAIQDLLHRALTNPRTNPPAKYAYIAPTRDQAKDIAWGYIERFVAKIPMVTMNQADLAVRLPNGATIRLYSGDSYERMRGLYFDGVVIDEYADIEPIAWPSVIRPCLSDYHGWATFIGTPKGRNVFFKQYQAAIGNEDWFTLLLKASESGLIKPNELADIKATTPNEIYRQEYECDFSVGRRGAIYARHLDDALAQGRICDVEHYQQVPTYTVFDVGAPHNQKVWIFQLVGDRINFLESLSGGEDIKTPSDWAAALRAKKYSYGTHFIPHDAAAEHGGLWQESLKTAGLAHVVAVPRQLNIWDGINEAVDNLQRCRFDKRLCADGLEALESYHAKEERDSATIRDVPVHDWSSHYADAFSLAHQAIRAGLVVDRSALPRANRKRGGVQVMAGFRGDNTNEIVKPAW